MRANKKKRQVRRDADEAADRESSDYGRTFLERLAVVVTTPGAAIRERRSK